MLPDDVVVGHDEVLIVYSLQLLVHLLNLLLTVLPGRHLLLNLFESSGSFSSLHFALLASLFEMILLRTSCKICNCAHYGALMQAFMWTLIYK